VHQPNISVKDYISKAIYDLLSRLSSMRTRIDVAMAKPTRTTEGLRR
jgi:hypothetical protein